MESFVSLARPIKKNAVMNHEVNRTEIRILLEHQPTTSAGVKDGEDGDRR